MANFSLIYKMIADDKAFKKGFDKASATVQKHTTAMKRNGAQSKDLSRHLTLLQNKARTAGVQFGTGSKQFMEAANRAKTYRIELDKLNDEMKRSGAIASKQGSGSGKQSAIAGVAMNRILPLIAINQVMHGLKNIGSKVVDFESQMSSVLAITGATEVEMEALTMQAKMLGSELPVTAVQVGKLQEELSKLGFSATEVNAATRSVINLSIATRKDLGEASVIVAQTLNAFALSAGDATMVTDVMAEAFTNSALDIDKFATGMPNVAAAADKFGWSLQRTTALLGILSDNGIDASKMGTDLRMIITTLASEGLTLEEALSDINRQTDRVSASQKLFGQRAFVSALALADQVDVIDDLTSALNESDNAASDMADTMTDNLKYEIIRMTSAFDAFIYSIEDGSGVLARFVRDSISSVTRLLELLRLLNTSAGDKKKEAEIRETEDWIKRDRKELMDSVMKEQNPDERMQDTRSRIVKPMLDKMTKEYNELIRLAEEYAGTNLKASYAYDAEARITKARIEALESYLTTLRKVNDESGRGSGSGSPKKEKVEDIYIQDFETKNKNRLTLLKEELALVQDRRGEFELEAPLLVAMNNHIEKLSQQIKNIQSFTGKKGWLGFDDMFTEELNALADSEFLTNGMSGVGVDVATAFFDGFNQTIPFLVDTAADGLVAAFESAFTGTGDPLSAYFDSLLGTFGDFLIQWGSGILAAGIGAQALAALSPAAMIAAGAGMVILGAAMKGAANSMVSGGSVGSSLPSMSMPSVSTPSGYSQYSTGIGGGRTRASGSGAIEVVGEFRVKGTDLVAALDNQKRRSKNYR